ncbi:MAG: hypothetical protein PHC39_04985 [Proteiniphilum sp.]|nr:hypothetical protein [Proteiniphilum sp.]
MTTTTNVTCYRNQKSVKDIVGRWECGRGDPTNAERMHPGIRTQCNPSNDCIRDIKIHWAQGTDNKPRQQFFKRV